MAYAISEPSTDSFDGVGSVHSPSQFINEINYNEIEMLQTVGRGAFGVVQKAKWNNLTVAIKILDNGGKEFTDEVSNLAKVKHANIIKLYGTIYNKPKFGLVMEYADCGSLYNLLHPMDTSEDNLIPYTFAHVMSWSLQCARAVDYLHQTKPKAIVHRDLKPPNMLLNDFGRILKICDFGTATAQHTRMTENKGSPSWMAPEVFEGPYYTEKCDVYSFGIVLWEMLTRKKPFDEIGPPAYRIMWAVHKGTRPPPIQNIPKGLEELMTSCWQKNDKLRPTFQSIVQFFEIIDQFVNGGDEPLFEFVDSGDEEEEEEEEEKAPYSNTSNVKTFKERTTSNHDIEDAPRLVNENPPSLNKNFGLLQIDQSHQYGNPIQGIPTHNERTFSDHDQLPFIPIGNNPSGSSYDTGIPNLPPYPSPRPTYDQLVYDKRSGGYFSPSASPSPFGQLPPPQVPPHNTPSPFGQLPPPPVPPHKTPSPNPDMDPYNNRGMMGAFPQPTELSPQTNPESNSASGIDFSLVPQELMPITPIETLPLSVQMYENHMESLKNYIDLQHKIKEMKSQKDTIVKNIEEIDKEQKRNSKYLADFLRLQTEKQSLLELRRNIKSNLEQEKVKRNIPLM